MTTEGQAKPEAGARGSGRELVNLMATVVSRRQRFAYGGMALVLYLVAYHGVGFAIFLAFGGLARAVEGLSVRHRMLVCALWGISFSAIFSFWSLLYDWPLWCILLLIRGLPWALFPLPALLLERRGVGGAWCVLAYGFGLGVVAQVLLLDPTGFDWETPVAALAYWPWCLTLLPWLRLAGMAVIIGVISSLLWQGRRGVLLGVCALVIWAGVSAMLYPDPSPPSPVPVALVQTGWSWSAKWAPENRTEAYRRLFDLSAQAQQRGAQLIIWPETAWPLDNLRGTRDQARMLSELAISLKTELLASSIEKNDDKWHNSSTLVSNTGRFAMEYRKRRLLPLQEYLPLPASWEAFLRERNWVRPSCHYQAGDKDTVFESVAGKFAVLICYESVVPGPAARMAEKVDFFVVQSNDAGMRSEFARQAHFRSAILRAAQFRKPVFQCANDGVSGFIDARGAVLARGVSGSTTPEIVMMP